MIALLARWLGPQLKKGQREGHLEVIDRPALFGQFESGLRAEFRSGFRACAMLMFLYPGRKWTHEETEAELAKYQR